MFIVMKRGVICALEVRFPGVGTLCDDFQRNRMTHIGNLSTHLGLKHGYVQSMSWLKVNPITK